MRLVEYVPNSHYGLTVSLRIVGKHARDLSQGKRRKRVTATLQRRAYRWRMGNFARLSSQNFIRLRKLNDFRAPLSRKINQFPQMDEVLRSSKSSGRERQALPLVV